MNQQEPKPGLSRLKEKVAFITGVARTEERPWRPEDGCHDQGIFNPRLMVRSHPDRRWVEVIGRSEALHVTRAVLLGLNLAKSLPDAPLPEKLSSVIQNDRRVRPVSRLIQRRLFARTRKIGLLEKATIFFMTQERLRNRVPHLAYSFHKAVTSNQNDTGMFYLPSWLYFLYYPLRAIRLSRAALGRMFNRTT